MGQINLIGGAYQSRSVLADAQMCMGWYVENIESQLGESAAALYPCPGLKIFGAPEQGGNVPGQLKTVKPFCRGSWYIDGRAWVVIGNNLFEVFADGSFVWRNQNLPFPDDGLPASMVSSNLGGNPGQLAICAGGQFFVLNTSTNAVQRIAQANFNDKDTAQVGYCQGFFIVSTRASNLWFVSAALDATQWPNQSGISVFAENIVTMIVDHTETFFASNKRAIIYYVSGNPLFPLDVAGGTSMEVGSGATFATVRMNNTFYWLEESERGSRRAVYAQGYTPVRCSTHAIEYAWGKYERIDDAQAFTYQQEGHEFWQIWFPTADKTWVFDAATNIWHERGFRDKTSDPPVIHAHRACAHMFAFGKHLVGDRASTTLYEMNLPKVSADGNSWEFCDDFGNSIPRIRRAPFISKEQERIGMSQLQILLEPGLALPGQFPANQPGLTFNLLDSNNQLWAIAVDDEQHFIPNKTAAGGYTPRYLNDTTNQFTFQLTITPQGNVVLAELPINLGQPQSIRLVSNTGQSFCVLGVESIGNKLGQIVLLESGKLYRGAILMLSWSDDGCKTFARQRFLDCGQAGETTKRIIQRRMGMTRHRVFQIEAADPVPYYIINGFLEADGYQPGERLVKEMTKRA